MSGSPDPPLGSPIPSDLLFLSSSLADPPRSSSPVALAAGSSSSPGVQRSSGPIEVGDMAGNLQIGDSSGIKPDPRWPYLHRWTKSTDTSPPIVKSPASMANPKSEKLTEDSAAGETSSDIPNSRSPQSSTDFSSPPASSPLRSFQSKPPLSRIAKKGIVTVESKPPSTETVPTTPTASTTQNKQVVDASVATTGLAAEVMTSPLDPTISVTLQSRLGAWAKPIQFASSSLPNASVRAGGEASDHSTELWPSLTSQRNVVARKHFKEATHAPQKQVGLEDDVRFPWAARMNPASRNLYRAVEPEYLDDGTPKVIIPNHVLQQGLENQKEYILGQFFRCSAPPGGLIHAVFNKLWGRKCPITIRKLGESNYLFHIPDEGTRKWVLQRGLWHVDDCLMFVASWNPKATLAIPEIKTIPVWVTLKKIPNILYSIKGISHIASGLGAPMATYKPLLDPILMEEAKILVEVELNKAFPPRIAASDEKGFISMVDVEYAWIPTTCSRCGQLGHKVKRCLKSVSEKENVDSSTAPISAATSPRQTSPAPANDIEVTPSPTLVSPSIDTSVEAIPAAPPAIVETTIDVASPIVLTSNNILATNDSPLLESASSILNTDASLTIASVPLESEQSELCLGTNKFASLASTGEEEDDIMELMTPPGKRILRDRPVKASAKAQESNWQVKGRGRGSGRGNRGRGRGGQG